MLRKIDHTKMGRSNLGWLQSLFHFSFAEYYNPNNINFGMLRVVNDDLVQPGTGFGTHSHRDMEIVSYVIDGELTHEDSMGNKNTLERGQVQYMSAGTGVSHSEYNFGQEVTRFLQIWIFPDQAGLTPNYGDYKFNWEDRHNRWLHMVSGREGQAPIKIYQDANLSVVDLDARAEIDYQVGPGRQAYLIQIEGQSQVNGLALDQRDALEVVEEDIRIQAQEKSHIMVIEMAKVEFE